MDRKASSRPIKDLQELNTLAAFITVALLTNFIAQK
jgi:hypothetical protein